MLPAMREGTASRTAIWVAVLRGLGAFDAPAVADDPLAASLVPFPYRVILQAAARSPVATRALLRSAARVSRNLSRHMSLRTRAIDDAVQEEARAGSTQLVLLGAGLDARAYRLEALADSVVFEVDHPATQRHKRAAAEGHPPLAREVRYVSIDFERESPGDVLLRAGLDPAARATFVWEGVTMYLPRAAIDATLASVARVAAPGSCLVATYYDARPILAQALGLGLLVRAAGEPFRSRMPPEEVRDRLMRQGFEVVSDEGMDAWGRRYLGEETPGSGERIVRARRS